jgi:thioredoxin-like negative regulator of GroEL
MLFAKIDTDRNPRTGPRFGIRGIPTLIAFRNGKEVARRVGAVPPADLDSFLNSI